MSNLTCLSIEINNTCNLACIRCIAHGPWYAGQTKRYPKYMSFEMVRNIVDQYDILHSEHKHCLPQFQGESLLHPDFLEICKYINTKKNMSFGFTTNAMNLTKEISKELLRLPNFGGIGFSVDGITKTMFEMIRQKSNYETVMQNIEDYLILRDKMKREDSSVTLNFVCMPENKPELNGYFLKWLSDTRVSLVSSSYATNKDGNPYDFFWQPYVREKCKCLYQFMIILTNGQAIPCCFDHLYKFKLGNINDIALKEIWHGERYGKLRNLHEEAMWNKHPLCKICDSWKSGCNSRDSNDGEILTKTFPFHMQKRRI